MRIRPVETSGLPMPFQRRGQGPVIVGSPDPLAWANKADGAKHAWDFIANAARWNGQYIGALANTPNWTFTRASTGYAQTSGGVLQSFASGELRRTDKGVLMEGAGTNKCTNYNANPTDTTNVTKGGDAAATLTVVDDTTELSAAGLGNICSSGKVYKLDNSAGAALAFASISGASGNTNSHTASMYVRGSGGCSVNVSSATITYTALTSSYVRRSTTQTPADATKVCQVVANVGAIVYFILTQFEEAAFASSPIVVAGASATRAADSLTVTGVTGLAYPLTIYCECELSSDAAGNQPAIWIDNGSGNTDLANLAAQMSTKKLRSTITASSAAQADISSTASSLAVGSVFKGALRVATNDAQQGLNGALATADTSVTLPSSPTILRFGINNTPGYLYGYIRRAAIYSRALTNAELQAVST